MVQAAALERVVHFARAIAGDDHVRRSLGLDGPDLRDSDREVGEHLEQVRLELLIGAVDLVDQQDRRLRARVFQGAQEGPADQELFGKDVLCGRLLRFATRLE